MDNAKKEKLIGIAVKVVAAILIVRAVRKDYNRGMKVVRKLHKGARRR